MKIQHNIPLQLFFCLVFALSIGSYIPKNFVEYSYTLSTVLTDVLMHLLPFLVFSYIAVALSAFHAKGLFLVVFILLCMCLSNALTVLTGYGASIILLPHFMGFLKNTATLVSDNTIVINSLWQLPFRPFIPLHNTMLFAAIVGIILGTFPITPFKKALLKLRDLATTVFKKGFIPLLPLYVLGFLLKIAKQGTLWPLIQSYSAVFLFTCSMLIIYLSICYFLAASGNIDRFKSYLKAMLPAGITGFSTVSSAATMPVTINATEQNIKNRDFADFVIPVTVNTHLIGDGISISITAMALMIMHGLGMPDLSTYLIFVFYYCLAKFSCAGVPGGGVLVLVPVFQQYLGMSPELASLLASIYILQDPILTTANVMGNGVFAIITHKFAKKLKMAN